MIDDTKQSETTEAEAIPTLNPNALSEIFAKSGEDLTDDEINILITRFRAERVQVLADEQSGKAKKASSITKETSAAKKAALAAALKGLDIGLDNL